MNFRKFLAIIMLGAFLAVPGICQTADDTDGVDTVIIASTENYPDAMVATATAEKLGVPILLTDREEVPEEVMDSLEQYSPSKVVLVGGESVISEDVSSSLSQDYSVDRVWGVTRYGTAVQISDYFWPEGADKAILVENTELDEEGDVLSQARSLSDGSSPIFLTPSGKLPVSVTLQLQDLGVSEVTYVGTPVSDEFRDQLEEVNISFNATITGNSNSEIKERIRERARLRINRSKELVVVAATGFRHSLASVNNFNSNSYVVGNSSDIEGLLDYLNSTDITNVKIVGEPQFSERIASAIDEALTINISMRGVKPSNVASYTGNQTSKDFQRFRRIHERRSRKLREEYQNKAENLERRANHSLMNAEQIAEKYNFSDEVMADLGKAREMFGNGSFAESMKISQSIISRARLSNWQRIAGNRSAVQEEIQDEVSDMQEKIQEMREMNREFAQQMRENLSTEERLEIINELRNERREQVREIVEKTREIGNGNKKVNEKLREAREEIRERRRRGRNDDEDEDEEEEEMEEEVEEEFNNTEIKMGCRDRQRFQNRIAVSTDGGEVKVEGAVGLTDLGYVPGFERQVFQSNNGIYFRYNFDRKEDFMGAMCLGKADYSSEFEPEQGNWTVTAEVFIGDEKVQERTEKVSIMGEEEDSEDDSDMSSDDSEEDEFEPVNNSES